MTEDEMAGWHHLPSGHEFEQTPGDGEAWRSLARCSPWGHKSQTQLDTTVHIYIYIHTHTHTHFIVVQLLNHV